MNNKILKFLTCFLITMLPLQAVYAAGVDEASCSLSIYIGGAVVALVVVLLLVELVRTKNKLKNGDYSNDDKQLIEKIKKGFETDEFKMYLQFIVDNKSKKIVSAEALSRWEPANGEVIMPGRYIPLMEKTGLIAKLDYHMFELVCKKLTAWKDTEFSDYTISCNFTRITISDSKFVETIKNIAEKYDFDRSKLLIEITEVKKMGFRIASDDIGSGYTSLISMCGHPYPIDVIKLDREILLLTDDSKGQKLFLGIISLAHNLDLKVVCEGVETEEQNTLVSDSCCDYIQGWYYAKALPEDVAEGFARDYMKNF